jgi:predicted flap endonuclease-1-like 5' DNA nuclease
MAEIQRRVRPGAKTARYSSPEDQAEIAAYRRRFYDYLAEGMTKEEALAAAGGAPRQRVVSKRAQGEPPPPPPKPSKAAPPAPPPFQEPEPQLYSEPGGDVPRVQPEDGDDLMEISGIGSNTVKRLRDLGITSFVQIASWSDETAEQYDKQLNLRGRILREEWVKQARRLVK